MKFKDFWKHPTWYLWFLPGLAAFAAQRLLAGHPQLTETVISRGLFRWLSIPIATVTSLVPFSLTEALLVIGIPLLLVLLIIWLINLARKPDKLSRTGRLLCRLAWTASFLYLAFMLLHGLNYARQPVAVSFDLPVRERSATELEEAAAWLVEQTNVLRADRLEDEKGVFKLGDGVGETLRTAVDAYEAASVQYPLMSGAHSRPKGVLLSHPWSYTGIAGMYFPFLVESNVNIDMPEHVIPATTLHEIAHTRGFAREDEAGFIAFLAGIADSRPDIAYSVTVDAALRAMNALYGVDKEAWERVARNLSEAAWRDIAANGEYWKQFEGPVRETSNQINNAYLEANLQEDGVRSYGRMLDLVLAWHEVMAADGTLDSSIAALNSAAG
jgi:hypothetical protein